jgi:hypothetical protein
VKGGVSLAVVPNIPDGVEAASAILDRRVGYSAGGFVAISLGKDSQISCGKG